MNKLDKLIEEFCPNGVEYRPLYEITIWNKKFNGTTKIMQPSTTDFKHISAKSLRELEHENGDVRLLSTGNFDGYTFKDEVLDIVNYGEIITIPSGGTANIKYYHGFFVDSGNLLATTINKEKYLLKYIWYFLLEKQGTVQSYFRGSAVQHPDMLSILKIKIPIPPLPIQKKIVHILDNFTEFTAELTTELTAELIARKQQYEYYRDSLLTFGDEVEWKTLGEIGIIERGNGLQKSDFLDEGFPCIHYGQIYTYYGLFANKTISYTSKELAKRLKKVSTGDIIIAVTSENLEDVCKPLVWLGENDVVTGGHTAIFRHNQNPKYIGYYLQTYMFFKEKRKLAQGTKVIEVTPRKLENVKIPIPPLPEQKRIVSILDKFDKLVNDISVGLPAEIKARKQQYEYYRNKLLSFKENKNKMIINLKSVMKVVLNFFR